MASSRQDDSVTDTSELHSEVSGRGRSGAAVPAARVQSKSWVQYLGDLMAPSQARIRIPPRTPWGKLGIALDSSQ